MIMFEIEDTKAKAYFTPFFAENVEVALRLLDDPCNDPTHNFHKHSRDYHLYECGNHDQETGVVTGVIKKHICSLETLVREVVEFPNGDWKERSPEGDLLSVAANREQDIRSATKVTTEPKA